MTNAEAIEHLKNIKIYNFHGGYTDEAREALDMAIKALETHTPCDLCVYNPPSRYGKPCSCCPAEPYKEDENEQT